ncbi:nuclear factor of kappa light polypeptide gene enhancer in B-cells [Nesidiocoris tenuis]|uniref:Nuclear factor of kappa light polypeptide gene enhancer in B-cells n=1 Tax=Nesidiocoris tenuis TaxID=355587 RepID=A0ABN7ATU9_9HEMI|nr:nuclear factor of kappa light polypeptide gene enhancer in B-cells [Nesidiocoris tenuis]
MDIKGTDLATAQLRFPRVHPSGSHMSQNMMSPDSGFGDDGCAFSPDFPSPVIEIVDQPEDIYNFRYRKESKKPHGPLKSIGCKGGKPKSAHGPRIQLKNFYGKAVIRTWLLDGEGQPSLNRLVTSSGGKNPELIDEPHDIFVDESNDFQASFDKLNILHGVVTDIQDQKKYLRKKRYLPTAKGALYMTPKDFPVIGDGDSELYKKEFNNHIRKDLDKNTCKLLFEVYIEQQGNYLYYDSVLSNKILNKKSPKTNVPHIVKFSHAEGPCKGGTAVLMFTEKLVKEVRIVFRSCDGDDPFEKEAKFDKDKDIHKQVGVAFVTPPYKNVSLSEPVEVCFYIERLTDRAQSKPVRFRYMPVDSYPPVKRKRAMDVNAVPILAELPLGGVAETQFGRGVLSGTERSERHEIGSFHGTSLSDLKGKNSMISNPVLTQAALPLGEDPITALQCEEDVPSGDFGSFHGSSLDDQINTDELMHLMPEDMPEAYLHLTTDSLPRSVPMRPVGSPSVKLRVENGYEMVIPKIQGSPFPPPETPIDHPDVPAVADETTEDGRELVASHLWMLVESIESDENRALRELRRNHFILKPPYINWNLAGKTLLHHAVIHHRSKVILELLKLGADPYALDDNNSDTAIHLATLADNIVLQQILPSVTPPRFVFNRDGDDPLLFAVRKGQSYAMKLLLAGGFDPNVHNVKNGDTPLHIAVDNDQKDMVDFLLKSGADSSLVNFARDSALHYAVSKQNALLIEKMLENSDPDDFLDAEGEEGDMYSEIIKLSNDPRITKSLENFFQPLKPAGTDLSVIKQQTLFTYAAVAVAICAASLLMIWQN